MRNAHCEVRHQSIEELIWRLKQKVLTHLREGFIKELQSSQPLGSANSNVDRHPGANSLCLSLLSSQRNVKLIYVLLLGGTSSENRLIWDQTLNARGDRSSIGLLWKVPQIPFSTRTLYVCLKQDSEKHTLTEWSWLFIVEVLIVKLEPLSTPHLTSCKKWNSDDFG